MNMKKNNKKVFYGILLASMLIQNVVASSTSWADTFKNMPASIFNWAQENQGKALVGGIAGLILTYACYQRYTDYCAITSADTFLETLPLEQNNKQAITEVFAPYRNRGFINKQNELLAQMRTTPLETYDFTNPLRYFKIFFFNYDTMPEQYKYLLPSVTSTFYFYTLLASQNLLDSKTTYEPNVQNMFYIRPVPSSRPKLEDFKLKDSKEINPLDITENYKIHLMPKKEEFIPVIVHLMQMLQKDTANLARWVRSVKIDPTYILDYDERIKKNSDDIVAGIIIYSPLNKHTAQGALNEIYQNFKQFKGNNIRPRFNAQVTDLIYVAQGDADDKLKEDNRKWFEQPNMIYYNHNQINVPQKKAGYQKDYYLTYPGTDINIIEPIRPTNVYRQ